MRNRTKIVLFVVLACASAALAAEEKAKSLYKTYHLNTHTVVVTCKDGAAPTIENYQSTGAIFVSCKD